MVDGLDGGGHLDHVTLDDGLLGEENGRQHGEESSARKSSACGSVHDSLLLGFDEYLVRDRLALP
jgi:hypothetical protein